VKALRWHLSKAFLANPESVLELSLAGRNCSVRPGILYGLHPECDLLDAFDLVCALRLRIYDLEVQRVDRELLTAALGIISASKLLK
jgi:hypothetical protein